MRPRGSRSVPSRSSASSLIAIKTDKVARATGKIETSGGSAEGASVCAQSRAIKRRLSVSRQNAEGGSARELTAIRCKQEERRRREQKVVRGKCDAERSTQPLDSTSNADQPGTGDRHVTPHILSALRA